MSPLFHTPKPRRFRHEYIYHDEQQQKLRDIEKRARRELGMNDEEGGDNKPHHEFCFASSRGRQRQEAHKHTLGANKLLIMLFVLLIMSLIILFS